MGRARADRRQFRATRVEPGRRRRFGGVGRDEVGRGGGCCAGVPARARRGDGATLRSRFDRRSPWTTRHPDVAHRRRAHHGTGISRCRGVHPPPRGIDRRRLPPPHDQRPHLLRGCHPRHVGERDLRCRIRGPDGLHRFDTTAHPGGVVEPARRVQCDSGRRGAHRRRTGGEVHRRRGDVGEYDAGAAGKSCGRPGRTPARTGCRIAGPRGSRLRPGAGHRRRLFRQCGQPGGTPGGGRSAGSDPWRRPTFATSWSTGPPFRRIRWYSRVSTLR